jgi:integrase
MITPAPCARPIAESNVIPLRIALRGRSPAAERLAESHAVTLPGGVLAAHLKHLRLRGQTTYHRERALARMSAIITVPLLEATRGDLLAWREAIGHLAPETIVHYVSHANQFYEWAIEEGLADRNPAARLPVPKTGRRVPRPISEDDLMRAVECAPRRIRPWLVLAGWCAFRDCEIAYLQRESVLDTRRSPVVIVAADATKGLDERVVPLSPFVLGELYDYGLPARGFVFRRRDGKPGPNTPALISLAANTYLHSIGIAETMHKLRARCLTQLHEETLDIVVVKDAAGHKSLATTAIYTKMSQPRSEAGFAALPVPGRLRAVPNRKQA